MVLGAGPDCLRPCGCSPSIALIYQQLVALAARDLAEHAHARAECLARREPTTSTTSAAAIAASAVRIAVGERELADRRVATAHVPMMTTPAPMPIASDGLHRAEEAHRREQVVADLADVRAEPEQQREHERGRPQPAIERARARTAATIGSAIVSTARRKPRRRLASSRGARRSLYHVHRPLKPGPTSSETRCGNPPKPSRSITSGRITGSQVMREQHGEDAPRHELAASMSRFGGVVQRVGERLAPAAGAVARARARAHASTRSNEAQERLREPCGDDRETERDAAERMAQEHERAPRDRRRRGSCPRSASARAWPSASGNAHSAQVCV